ncbi:MAG: carbohydrate binding family 9 domain-containing protein [Gammaproteobacteria bacterium]|nr:carbohydrate binding family 9 domain-containing protein [Gammaproteobacteria bacterium]
MSRFLWFNKIAVVRLMGLFPTLLCMGLLVSNIAIAQQDVVVDTAAMKEFRVARISTPPVIDGKLDDAAWQQAVVITDFHQISPGDGTPPSELTELYVVYDDDALYIAARMYDSEPELISAPTIRHGQGLGSDDRLVVILDPFNTRRAGYRFETNLNGVRHDSLYQNLNSFQIEWNTIWDVATSVDGKSWVAELEIPFKSLPFDPELDTWGFNFGRGIRRRGEEVAWVSQNRRFNPNISGRITGLTGMDKGVGLDIVPSMSVSQRRRFDPGSSDSSFDPSLDAFYRVTPSVNAALTINTDFSATEVDNRQVNLTRFNLFFPEKRDFFLNDSDLFQFGNISSMAIANNSASPASRENARPYFSRKLGLSQTGEPVDIDYGGRVSGRIGRWNFGTLVIHQDEFGDVDATDLLVARVSANVLSDSTIGFIYTDGDPTSDLDNSVTGVDFQYQNNHFIGNRTLSGDIWYQQSDTPGLDGEDASFGFGMRSSASAGLRSRMAFKEVQRNFNPAMGFVNRSNIRDITADIGYTHFYDSGFIQSAFAGVDFQRIEIIDGGLQTERMDFRLMELKNNSRDSLFLTYNIKKEVLVLPFTIYSEPDRQVVIQPGSYEFDEQQIKIESGGQRTFSGSFTYLTGEFFDGDRTNLKGSMTWNQSRFFTMSLSYDWNDIELPQGDFITRLSTLSTQVAFSSTLYWINLLQYDNLSEEMGINTRLQWVPRAGQEGFIVLNYNMQDIDKDNRFESTLSDLSVKFRYTIRF